MTKEDLSKLIDECCDDIFDRKEPLVNVKARLYYTLKKQLTLTDVVERLPVGEVIKLIDSEDFKGYTGELKITGHCSYMGKKVGHLVNGEGIFLIEDFVR